MDAMDQNQVEWLATFLHVPAAKAAPVPGLYRATVVGTDDPLEQGRIEVVVPELSGEPGWALPCQRSGAPAEPPTAGSSGWVMFERGDQSCPVWMGAQPVDQRQSGDGNN